jgi:hypothetical protein
MLGGRLVLCRINIVYRIKQVLGVSAAEFGRFRRCFTRPEHALRAGDHVLHYSLRALRLRRLSTAGSWFLYLVFLLLVLREPKMAVPELFKAPWPLSPNSTPPHSCTSRLSTLLQSIFLPDPTTTAALVLLAQADPVPRRPVQRCTTIPYGHNPYFDETPS